MVFSYQIVANDQLLLVSNVKMVNVICQTCDEEKKPRVCRFCSDINEDCFELLEQ
jgi:hypothetical protein